MRCRRGRFEMSEGLILVLSCTLIVVFGFLTGFGWDIGSMTLKVGGPIGVLVTIISSIVLACKYFGA